MSSESRLSVRTMPARPSKKRSKKAVPSSHKSAGRDRTANARGNSQPANSLRILDEARSCTHCKGLPLGPRPLLAGSATSRILIIGQAPGKAAHESGIPWNDPSGDRLRDWMGITREVFYDTAHIALMPMGFCYPGKGKSGDMPPRAECAPLWHDSMRAAFVGVKLTIFVGRYACSQYLNQYDTLLAATRDYKALLPQEIALPHPSPRNNIWLKKNAWFEQEAVPRLRRRIKRLMNG